ncbi:MAG TPA: GerMN domain-containing protein [Jatrophihabitans sp.]|nr:GerMN domain-containing protein [Jatrophihabitans sp.]
MTRRWPASLAAAALVLVGCTTVPSSSSPQVVRTLNHSPTSTPRAAIVPRAGDSPANVVDKFISAGVQADAQHSASRQFLTATAARKWQDPTTLVVDDIEITTRNIKDNRATVTVSGRPVGQIAEHGIYTPTLKYLGSGVGEAETYTFQLRQSAPGQWRIDQLPQGVLIRRNAFAAAYAAGSELYFVDSSNVDSSRIALVPDLRYTSLTGQALATWLLTELLAGPSPELTQSVLSELPEQVGKPGVQLGDPIVVELPGTAQLDAQSRDTVAAQLAYTFFPQFEYDGTPLMITDSGRPVEIPDVAGTTFTKDNFVQANPVQQSASASAKPYYIRNGEVIDGSTDQGVAGYLGQSVRELSSIALRVDPAGGLQAAGVSNGSLLMGNDRGLTRVNLPPGQISRPEWRPHSGDVWIGLGSKGAVYRIGPEKRPRPVSITSSVGGGPTGQVIALRFSSDGVRLAAVVRNQDGTSAVWVGSVVTSASANDVRVVAFQPITAAELVVSDVAWSDLSELSVIASSPSKNISPRVWSLASDGSRVTLLSNEELPAGVPPTAIAAPNSLPILVSANGSIWAHASYDPTKGWTDYPRPGTLTPGDSPVFAQSD